MNQNDYMITRYHNQYLSALCQDGRLTQAFLSRQEETAVSVGTIVIAKVLNISKNIQAAFLEYAPGQRAYLPFSNIVKPIVCNRSLDQGDTLRQGDEVVIQIIKDAVKTKDPVCSAELTLAGRYMVLSRTDPRIHVSSKASQKQSARLLSYLKEHLNIEEYGFIVRTNAIALEDRNELLREYQSLCRRMQELTTHARSRTMYSILEKQPPDYLIKLRDTYALSYQRIITDCTEVYDELKLYFEDIHDTGSLDKLVLFQKKSMSLLNFYKLAQMLEEALGTNVWLRCGGYLVIECTESLVAIDVNSGKYTGKSDPEETFLKINLEAAAEIARQLRLRNLSGMILVDFINMKSEEHQNQLLEYFRHETAADPVQTCVIDMTKLGLVEVTRKKINKSLHEQLGNLPE